MNFPENPWGKTPWVLRAIDAPTNHMKTTARNPYLITATDALENEGFTPDTLEQFTRNAMFDATSPACCTEGCVVEPDGACSHGCPSILIALGLI